MSQKRHQPCIGRIGGQLHANLAVKATGLAPLSQTSAFHAATSSLGSKLSARAIAHILG